MLCGKNDETFNQLVFHTEVRWLSNNDYLERVADSCKEVRWLSKTNCIEKLVDLYYSTVEFLADVNQTLCEELKKCKNHPNVSKKLEEGADVSYRELEIYINQVEKVRKDFKVRFEDGEKTPVPD
ncbi:hypothetical protein T12_15009 [Trichinella patagoniensis]|uniref:Uncharacterized protein n=1 Tax=Trichinella patagoniensis TaxID=990121 RepID=A0A0V1A299_9BILA|nr:hypothetical protein T12_15009 [Trichinella patagoniensis]